jgi:two-component system KDP operon response regulator KdpE
MNWPFVGSCAQALRLAAQQPPDLVILDLGLPDVDGQEVLKQLREWLHAPIIVLSARDQEAQKIAALDHGADDYLTKPFSTGELLARIRVALRHAARVESDRESAAFTCGDLKVDLSARRVFVKEAEVHLTPIEYKLLTALVHHAGKVLTHRHILKEVWGPDQVQETHYLRVFMAGLRRKIETDPAQPRYLLTEQGVGYRLATE